jgi:hypothetical protein
MKYNDAQPLRGTKLRLIRATAEATRQCALQLAEVENWRQRLLLSAENCHPNGREIMQPIVQLFGGPWLEEPEADRHIL